MRLHRPFVAGLVGMLSISACSREEEPSTAAVPQAGSLAPAAATAPPIGYACESGLTVTVQYPDTATASLTYKGQAYALRLLPSASGARFVGSGLEWWIASRAGQETASLSRLGPNEDVGLAVLERCSRPSPNPELPPPGPLPVPSEVGAILPTAAPCRAAQLRVSSDDSDAGAGNRSNLIGVTNTGAAPCSVSGYPSVSLLDAQGRTLTTIRTDQTPATPTPVTLAANGKGYFDIAWNVVPNEGNGERVCPTATTVRVIVAGDPVALSLPLTFTPCGGRIRVNPFRSTTEPGVPTSTIPASATT
jgi:membrane-bound inhibitor of C-type lysozyme